MRIRNLITTGLMMAAAIALGTTPANADITGTLVVGSSYSTIISGGSIAPSTWNGQQLQYLYCIDTADDIYVPGTYSATLVNSDGEVTPNGGTAHYVGGSLTVVGRIAWILDNYGAAYSAFGQNSNQQIALQEAIWKAIYGSAYWYPNLSTVPTAAQTLATNLYTASNGQMGNIGNYLWFSPRKPNDRTTYQFQVGKVPEPTSIVLLGVFLVVGALGAGAKRKLARGE